jgi:lysophospholipase L1-like esterase
LVCGLFLIILSSLKGTAAPTAAALSPDAGENTKWVGTWGTAPQLTESSNMPVNSLSNKTLRQVVRVSIGGNQLRLKFSNEYGTTPLAMNSVHLAVSTSGSSIDHATDKIVTFGGKESVTVAAGGTVTSDTLDYNLPAMTKMAVTIYFGSVPGALTGHPGSRTTSYIQNGNAVAATSMAPIESPVHWYIITGIDVYTEESCQAMVALGDSITDGRGSTTDGNNRWTDCLAARLQANAATSQIAVLNQGIGGNAVLSGGLGPTALTRFDRDVLGQSGARYLLILEGINDIGGAATDISSNLINAYKTFITKARAKNMLVYGGTILPCGNNSYYNALHETIRQTVNTWIRSTGMDHGGFDAVIDFDAALRDAADPKDLASAYDSGDGLHPNVAGYQKMADIIDLGLFMGPSSSASPSPSPIITPSPSSSPAPTPSGATSGCLVTYAMNDWGGGATVTVVIKNNGPAAISGWTLVWNFSGNQKITNLWSGSYTQSDTQVTVQNAVYNGTISAGGSVNFGFNISYSGSNAKPAGFYLNGQACQVQ